MKIRLTGYPDELEKAVEKLKQSFDVISVSGTYPNRNNDQCRIYIDTTDTKEK